MLVLIILPGSKKEEMRTSAPTQVPQKIDVPSEATFEPIEMHGLDKVACRGWVVPLSAYAFVYRSDPNNKGKVQVAFSLIMEQPAEHEWTSLVGKEVSIMDLKESESSPYALFRVDGVPKIAQSLPNLPPVVKDVVPKTDEVEKMMRVFDNPIP